MLEPIFTLAAICPGACLAIALVAVGEPPRGIDATTWLQRRRYPSEAGRPVAGPWSRALAIAGINSKLADLVDRAGWKESPERLSAFAVGLSACAGVIGAAS